MGEIVDLDQDISKWEYNQPPYVVFLYDSLYFNGVLEKMLMTFEYAKAETKEKYHLIPTMFNNYVYKEPHETNIKGEIYIVSGEVFKQIDMYYSKEGDYYRKIVDVYNDSPVFTCMDSETPVWMYFVKGSYDNCLQTYLNEIVK